MKTKPVKEISIEKIVEVLKQHSVQQARIILSYYIGARMEISGTVLHKGRDSNRLFIQTDSMKIFAHFDALNFEQVKNAKIRKGSKVKINGTFASFGNESVCLEECRIIQI